MDRPALEPADRALLAGLARLLPRQRLGHLFVQPATLLGWHRDLVAKRWTHSHGRADRPPIAEGTTALVLRVTKENPTWGYRRIHGELATMGIAIAPSSILAILKRHGIEPLPRRSGPTWAELLVAQANGLMACDFFHKVRLLLRRRVRRRGHQDHGDPGPGTSGERDLRACGGTMRRGWLDRMLILGRHHLEAVLAEYVDHYDVHRPHSSLGQRSPSALDAAPSPTDDIDPVTLRRTDRLGGIIHEYRMVA